MLFFYSLDFHGRDKDVKLNSFFCFQRYGWFSNLEQTACQTSMTSHSYKEPNKSFEKHITSGDKLLCKSSKGHGPRHMDDSANQAVETHLLLEKTIQNGVIVSNIFHVIFCLFLFLLNFFLFFI